MPSTYQPMGGVPDFYTQLMSAARQQLVQQPDGTYAPAPQYGQPTSLDEIYAGVLPPSRPTLTARTVNTVPIDRNGNPIIEAHQPSFRTPTAASTMAEQSGSRPALTAGVQPAGTVTMPPGARPANIAPFVAPPVQTAQAPSPRMRPTSSPSPVWDPFNPNTPKVQDRLPTNAGEREFLDAFYPENGNSASAAIEQAAGAPPMPRVRPLPPAQIPLRAAAAPVPHPRPMPAQRSGGKSYTIQKGDTLWDISKRTGISVPDLAVMNNIRDPSRIMPGQEITLGGTLARTGQQTTAPARKVAPLPGRRTVTPLPIARTSPAVSPGSGVTVNGIDLAFMPASVQRRYQE